MTRWETTMRGAVVRSALAWMLAAGAMFVGVTAAAQGTDPDYVPSEDILAQGDETQDGWDFTLSLGATFNFSRNSSVIGQPNGTSVTAGSKVNFGADYNSGGHEVRNVVNVTNTFTRTPVVDEFVRTNDLLALESIYYYHPESVPWLGPFVRLNLRSSIFTGEDVQPEAVDYLIRNTDGTTELINAERLELTGPLQPLQLKESAGVFARPINHRWLRAELRIGLGSLQTFAEGGLAINDQDGTPEIEVDRLANSFQAGAEAVLSLDGSLFKKRVTYSAGVEALMPFITESDDSASDKGAVDLTNIEAFMQVSFKLVTWASLDYEFRAIRQPILLDEFQIQNNLLLTFGFTLLGDE